MSSNERTTVLQRALMVVRRRPAAAVLLATLLAFSLVGITGCGGEGDQEDRSPEPDQGAGAGSEAAGSWTGILSEDEFKRLHHLREVGEETRLHGREIEVAGARGYLSLPEGGEAPMPGIVVIHEWWGLNDHIRHWTDRLAADGYAALAVDLYGGRVAETADSAMAYVKTVDPEEAARILRAAHAYLTTADEIKAARTGVIGWCFGGAWSLQLALAEPDLDAAVLYYGRLVLDPTELARSKASILGIFGNQDESIPTDRVDAFEAALTEAGVGHQILRYDAPHAFANPSSANYHEAEAEEAWGHVRQFLAEHLR